MAHLSLWGTELPLTLLVVLCTNLHLQKELWRLKLWALLPKTTCELLRHPVLLHRTTARFGIRVFQRLACLPPVPMKLEEKEKDKPKRIVPQLGRVQAFLIFQCSISVQNRRYCQSYPPGVGGWQSWDFCSGYGSPYGVCIHLLCHVGEKTPQ